MQRDDAWYSNRLGKITASRIGDLMAKTKTGESASRKNYISQLVVERLTETKVETYKNDAMQYGIDTEAEAREFWENEHFKKVELCDFFDAPDISMSGASPDGLIDDDGLIEIKCPNSATHLALLLGGPIPRQYILQMQWQMYCTNRHYCIFFDYDNRFPLEMRGCERRVERDEKLIDEIKEEVIRANEEIESTLKKLRGNHV